MHPDYRTRRTGSDSGEIPVRSVCFSSFYIPLRSVFDRVSLGSFVSGREPIPLITANRRDPSNPMLKAGLIGHLFLSVVYDSKVSTPKD